MKLFNKKDVKKTEQEKVDERREEVLSAGRKFKYPLQWTKHRVVINTVLIAFIVLAIVFAGGFLALYRFNMQNDMLFRITKILPIPVATVDEESVRFSDYLMFLRSSLTSIEKQSGSANTINSDETLRLEYMRTALTEAEEYTYAMKLAKELGIEVTNEEIDSEFDRHLHIGGVERSEDGFMKIIEENFGLSKDEYRRMLYLALIETKVEIAIDENAEKIASKVESLLSKNGHSYSAVATELGKAITYEETGGMVSSQNIDGGRASAAINLEPGAESGRFVSMNGDGYYFVKLIKKTETDVNFVSIFVPFTEFKNRFNNLKNENKISEFVTLDIEAKDAN